MEDIFGVLLVNVNSGIGLCSTNILMILIHPIGVCLLLHYLKFCKFYVRDLYVPEIADMKYMKFATLYK